MLGPVAAWLYRTPNVPNYAQNDHGRATRPAIRWLGKTKSLSAALGNPHLEANVPLTQKTNDPVNVPDQLIVTDSDVFAKANAENKKQWAIRAQTDSLSRPGFVANATGSSGHTRPDGASAMAACTDPVFKQPVGVYGESANQGVMGLSTGALGTGVFGGNTGGDAANSWGVRGETTAGVAVQGQSFGTGKAGKFIGDVEVTGDIVLSGGQDCAEHFDIALAASIEPGMVMSITNDGLLEPSRGAYNRKVAGVVSGAGSFRPGLILGAKRPDRGQVALALIGRAFCWVDAEYAPIGVGDLLTTSETEGHAMKAVDSTKAFGATIGKAMQSVSSGRKLIPILLALQ